MNASGSVGVFADAGATMRRLTDVAGGGMQVEEDIGNLDGTQDFTVTTPDVALGLSVDVF